MRPEETSGVGSLPDPTRVVFASVAHSREPYGHATELLFASLRRYGGRLAQSPAIAYFVGDGQSDLAERLRRLDVEVRVTPPIDPRCLHANKIAGLELHPDLDYLVLLDPDTCVVRDISEYVTGPAVAIKPVDCDRLSADEWQHLFQFFGLPLPAATYLTTNDRAPVIPYFNSGVLIVPRQHVLPLRQAWQSFVTRTHDALAELPQIARHPYSDQYALSLALAATAIPVRPLPPEINFPTHAPIHPDWQPESMEPAILHHHLRFAPDGSLLPCSYDNINRTIDRINGIQGPIVARLRRELETSRGELAQREAAIAELQRQLTTWETHWSGTQGSISWRLVMALRRTRHALLPPGTRRERTWHAVIAPLHHTAEATAPPPPPEPAAENQPPDAGVLSASPSAPEPSPAPPRGFAGKFSAEDGYALSILQPLMKRYLPWSNGAPRPGAIVYILNDVTVHGRKEVLELGGGISTLLLARLLHERGGRLLTIEHDEKWACWLRRQLEAEGLSDVVTLCHAPLAPYPRALDGSAWYSDTALRSLPDRRYDLVLVDGPVAGAPSIARSRYPAVPFFLKRLAPDVTVCLDDAQRDGEKAVLHAWEAETALRFTVFESISLAAGRFPPHQPLYL